MIAPKKQAALEAPAMDMLRLHWPAMSAAALICLTALVCILHVVHAQVRCFSSNDIVALIPLLMGSELHTSQSMRFVDPALP